MEQFNEFLDSERYLPNQELNLMGSIQNEVWSKREEEKEVEERSSPMVSRSVAGGKKKEWSQVNSSNQSPTVNQPFSSYFNYFHQDRFEIQRCRMKSYSKNYIQVSKDEGKKSSLESAELRVRKGCQSAQRVREKEDGGARVELLRRNYQKY